MKRQKMFNYRVQKFLIEKVTVRRESPIYWSGFGFRSPKHTGFSFLMFNYILLKEGVGGEIFICYNYSFLNCFLKNRLKR